MASTPLSKAGLLLSPAIRTARQAHRAAGRRDLGLRLARDGRRCAG
jgi:hypothetical protein